MTHDEFLDKYYKDGYYWVDQIPDEWYGKANKWCFSSKLAYYLGLVGLTPEQWYSIYVPNPGCRICGNLVELHKLSRGWYVTCSPECESQAYSNRQISSCLEMWKNPENRKSLYLRMMEDKGITHSYFYILELDKDTIKFGVSYDPPRRAYELGGAIIYQSQLLPVSESALIECEVAKKFTTVSPCDCVDGNSEARYRSELHLILEFLTEIL